MLEEPYHGASIGQPNRHHGPTELTGRTVWVVDTHSLLYQVFHALPEMTSPQGEPVQAIFGFARDLFYLLEQKHPDYLFCALDMPGKTFRHEIYGDYKLQRKEMPDDLVPQIAPVRQLIEALGIPPLGVESYEADDVLATVARLAVEGGAKVVLVTSDKDCRQLLGDNVQLYSIRKDEFFDADRLTAEWGIAPQQVVDFQALVGDTSDNVPGVPLIGPKFARQLLEKYGTLDEVLDRASEVSGAKRRENLLQYRDQALLSRKLVRLDDQVPLEIDWEAGRVGAINPDACLELFERFGFRNLGDRLAALAGGSPQSPQVEGSYHLVATPEALDDLVAQMRKQPVLSLDTETTSLWPRWAELVGLSFAWNDDEAWYVPVRAPAGEPCLPLEPTLEKLRPILEDPAIKKVGQNLKYDAVVLRSAGLALVGIDFDTMVASYLLDAGRRNHNLDDLAKQHLGHTTIKISDLIGSGKNQKRMDEVPVEQLTDYAAEDALLPWRLRPILEARLKQSELERLNGDLEVPLIDVLAEMEFNGICVDQQRLATLSASYQARMEQLESEIFRLAGHVFNIGSPKQLQQVLFEEQGLPVVKRTKTGPSTDADVLSQLARLHELPEKIIEYRQYAKLKSTYVDALPEMVCPKTGRVHASFNQVVTATGRLSSSDPNLQNIPVRTEVGREIRSAFVPGEAGWLLLAADYSQIELRVLAHLSGDRQLREAFERDEDIHTRVASQVNHVAPEAVTPEMRRAAKAVNFGVIYGQSPFGLSKQLGIDQQEAARFIDAYFAGYPQIDDFLRETLETCRRAGYVSTILGRRRAIQGIRDGAGRQKNLAERTAINTIIQGSAADLIKLAMLAISRRLRREGFAARLLLQIHDELIFEVVAQQQNELARIVREEMEGAYQLAVPLRVDVKVGPNWADAAEHLGGELPGTR